MSLQLRGQFGREALFETFAEDVALQVMSASTLSRRRRDPGVSPGALEPGDAERVAAGVTREEARAEPKDTVA